MIRTWSPARRCSQSWRPGRCAQASARADGDPASDTLVFTNAFLPSQAPSKGASDALLAQIAAVYAAGYRVKVAVVAARYDLGAIPSLFDRPA